MTNVKPSTRRISGLLFLGGVMLASLASAQPGGQAQQGKGAKGGGQNGGQCPPVEELVRRAMAFDKNGDGSLSQAEVTDQQLLAVCGQADANRDGLISGDELTAAITRQFGGMGQGGIGGQGKGGFQGGSGMGKGGMSKGGMGKGGPQGGQGMGGQGKGGGPPRKQ